MTWLPARNILKLEVVTALGVGNRNGGVYRPRFPEFEGVTALGVVTGMVIVTCALHPTNEVVTALGANTGMEAMSDLFCNTQ